MGLDVLPGAEGELHHACILSVKMSRDRKTWSPRLLETTASPGATVAGERAVEPFAVKLAPTWGKVVGCRD
jgi:hypothetical protein